MKIFNSRILKSWYFLAYSIKILVALLFIYLYTNYYTNRSEADVYKYFDDGLVLYEVSKQSIGEFIILSTGIGGDIEKLSKKHLGKTRFWDSSPSLPIINDNRFIIRFNALLTVISNGNIYVHILVALFIAFLGLNYLFLFLKGRMEHHEKLLFLTVFFMPSLLLWTSSVLKESFLILGFGGLLYSMSQFTKKSVKYILFSVLFSILILVSKLYILLVLLPPLVAYQWNYNKSDGKGWMRYLVTILFSFGLAINVKYINANYDLLSILAFKQSEFKCLAEWIGARSIVYVPDLTSNLISYVKATPFALFNSILRPLPWDKLNVLSFLSMLEILAINALLIVAIIKRKKLSQSESNLFLFSISFTLILALLIGLTTPVMGAIVRYRIVFLPFLITLSLLMLDVKKLIKFTPFKTKI